MFTIKLYSDSGVRQRILSAESFTVLRSNPRQGRESNALDEAVAEITLHQKNQNDDVRYDIGPEYPPTDNPNTRYPQRFQRAIIENATGKTTEMITCGLG